MGAEQEWALGSGSPQNVPIKIFAPKERHLTQWVGGSILASLHAFSSLVVRRDEFAENPAAIHAKSL